jgi:endonuclease/exonuclease/phosphatase family metal-dependent hydrolase
LQLIQATLRSLNANVIALQEANDRDAAERLGAALGMHVYWAEANSPYAVAWLARDSATARNHRLPVLDKTLLELRLGSLRLFTTHLSAGRRVEDEPHRIDEMRAVLDAAADADVLVGDFNAVHPEDEVGTPPPEEVLEHVSREPIALALAAGFTDCFRALHGETDWTYQTWHPWARLDYVFTRSTPNACRVVTEADGASDHFPVVADLPP